MSNVIAIPALSDNYVWAIAPASPQPGDRVAIVDPGEAQPVQAWLAQQQLRIGAIIITHHHPDHTAGINKLLVQEHAAGHDAPPVYGPKAESDRIVQVTEPLAEGDTFTLDWLELTFAVLEVPGHTLGHIALHSPGMLLAGDTLFRGGCGRVFEGTAAQMHNSLARLRNLPETTRVYAGHEYTQKNLVFARMVEPNNPDIARASAQVDTMRADGRPSLPTTLAEERLTNPFLRWDTPQVAQAASTHAGHSLTDAVEIFAELRAWKNAS